MAPPIPTSGRSAFHSGCMYDTWPIMVRRGMPRSPSSWSVGEKISIPPNHSQTWTSASER